MRRPKNVHAAMWSALPPAGRVLVAKRARMEASAKRRRDRELAELEADTNERRRAIADRFIADMAKAARAARSL